MKKTLLATAVAAVVAGPMAAQADVTIYGRIDTAYESITNSALTNDGDHLTSNKSLLGFKGSEDLGNGNKAIFKVESTVGADAGTGTIGSRNTYAGLAGSWGTLIVGNHDTPYKIVGRKMDLFESAHLGENRAILNSGANGQNDLRVNTVAYISPTVNGIHGAVAYVPEDINGVAGGTAGAGAWSALVIYSNSGLFLAGGWQRVEGESFGVGLQNQTYWRFAAKYSMNNFTVGGMYQKNSDRAGVAGNDTNSWTLIGKYKAGANVFKLAYTKATDKDGATGVGLDEGGKMFTLGFDHNFSKRTKVYVNYSKLTNNSGATFSFRAGGHDNTGATTGGIAAGEDQKGLAIGIRHKF